MTSEETHALSESSNTPPGSEEETILRIKLPSALLGTSADLVNTNLLKHPHDKFKAAQIAEFNHLLEMAMRQRGQKLYKLAANNLESLLTGRAPSAFKREALLQLAILAEDQGDLNRAIQIYTQFKSHFVGDPILPEILLRQGLLYRQQGAPDLALAKFFAVMSAAVNLEAGDMGYSQHLVLQAQVEVGDTYFEQGRFREAADAFNRLLQQNNPTVNNAEINYKSVRCWVELSENEQVVESARSFLNQYAGTPQEPEVRFILSNTLVKLGQKEDALKQVFLLLESQERQTDANPTNWVYWKQRTGNQIANQLYQEGDYLSALKLYQSLSELSSAPAWRLPIWYQIGLIYEKQEMPVNAIEFYRKISNQAPQPEARLTPNLQTILDMATWRAQFLNWQLTVRADRLGETNRQALLTPPQLPMP